MNSGMVRIRAKAIQPYTAPGPYPRVNGILPSWCDVEIFVVSEDGTETPFLGVRSVKFLGREGAEPLIATLECYVDEIDVLASAHIAHDHSWRETFRDDNDNRIRTYDRCEHCDSGRYGCFAKTLGEIAQDGDIRGAWGPVGVWTYRIEPDGS